MFATAMMMKAGVVPAGAIQFVGGRTAGNGNAASAQTVGLSSGLTGGLATGVSAGDLVLVMHGWARSGTNPAFSGQIRDPDTADYTEVADQAQPNLLVGYKFMPETPDAHVTVAGTGANSYPTASVVLVFRGVDPVSPVIGAVLAGSGASGAVTFEAIAPGVPNAAVVAFAFNGTLGANNAFADPGDLDGFYSGVVNDSNGDAVCGGGYLLLPSGSFTPASWSGPATGSWQRALLALRPA